tara:strand:+ start:4234 stop:5631 length:1398 start_codon:yes stop_codon:yes gene_type:complete
LRVARILVVDDETGMLEVYEDTLSLIEGIEVHTENTSRVAAERLKEEDFDVLITDLRMPGLNGVDLLKIGRESDPDLPVLMITAYPSVDTAIEAMKLGAIDYITKPFVPDELLHNVRRMLEGRTLKEENRLLRRQLEKPYGFGEIIGTSKSMQEVFALIQQVAKSNVDVLILGETGTGKELVARSIHLHSQRESERFVPIDCGAIPENLVESEFFGFERGAFTGAQMRNIGLLEFANRGTCFLDEIGELPLVMQAKLLRALQERVVRRVGGREEIPVDIRIVAATCRDVELAVEKGDFREDLYFRINVVQICLPPLREREGDIVLLARHFLERHCQDSGKDIKGFSEEARRALTSYAWPGNIRELQNVVRRAIALTQSESIGLQDLPLHIRACEDEECDDMFAEEGAFFDMKERTITHFERTYLTRLLQKHKGDIVQAIEEAQVPRGTLYRLLKKYNLSAKDYRE